MVKVTKEYVQRLVEEDFKKYGWTKEQQKTFKRFINERYAKYDNPQRTIKNYLHILNLVVQIHKKPFSEITKEDIFEVLRSWREKGYSKTTMHGRKCKLKAFFRWESGNKYDPRVEDIKAGRYVSTKTIDDLLTEEEIKEIRKAAKDNPRDLAMVDFHLLWGPRPSESASLNVGHVKVNENYIVVNIPETKTTARPVPIPLAKASVIQDPSFLDYALNAYMSMRSWLNIHPYFPDHPEKPLWLSDENGKERLKPLGVTAVFRRLGSAAGIQKSISTYDLRRTAFNLFPCVDREKLCAGFGWKPGSRMPTQVYNKLRPQDHLKTLIKEEGEERERDINICADCKRENPRDFTFCAWCGAPLTELPITATLKRFYADQEAQEEFNKMREKMTKIEKILSNMEKIPGFYQILEQATRIEESKLG